MVQLQKRSEYLQKFFFYKVYTIGSTSSHCEKSNVNFPSGLETFPIIVTGISQILCEFLLIFKGISQNHEILQKKCGILLFPSYFSFFV